MRGLNELHISPRKGLWRLIPFKISLLKKFPPLFYKGYIYLRSEKHEKENGYGHVECIHQREEYEIEMDHIVKLTNEC